MPFNDEELVAAKHKTVSLNFLSTTFFWLNNFLKIETTKPILMQCPSTSYAACGGYAYRAFAYVIIAATKKPTKR